MSASTLKNNNFNTQNIAPINRLAIRSRFVKKFVNTFTFTLQGKQGKLDKIKLSKTLLKYVNMYETTLFLTLPC